MRLLRVCALVALAACVHARRGSDDVYDDIRDAVFNQTSGPGLRFLGKGGALVLTPPGNGSSPIRVKFGQVQEVSSAGKPLRGGSSLRGVQPTFSQGTTTVDGKNVSYASLSWPLSTVLTGSSSTCPGIPMRRLQAAEPGFINATVYFGFTQNTSFPYGTTTVVAQPKTFKVSIAASGWQFCNPSNKLRMYLNLETDRPEGHDYPVLLNSMGVEARINTTINETASFSTRKLLREANSGGGKDDAATGVADDKGGKGRGSDDAFPSAGSDDLRKRLGDDRSKVANFLVDASTVAMLNLQTYAFDTMTGTTQYNVTVDMMGNGEGGTNLVLDFPSFTKLYYDPDVSFIAAADAGYNVTAIAALDTPAKASAFSTRPGLWSALASLALVAAMLA